MANQTQNLAAALNNFEGVQKAYTLAVNSAGSAMQENEAVSESLAFKQNQLSASFQEVANNLISSDFVGLLLSVANGLLQVDNATGNVVSRILLLTSLGWGGSQLLRVSKIIPVITEQFKNFASVIEMVRGGAGTLGEAFNAVGKGTGVLSGFFSASLPIMLGVAAAITAIVVLVKGLKQMYDATFPTVDDFNQSIAENNKQLETNKQRLEEINKIPWNERTQEILDEKAALEAENDELRKNIELTEQKQLTAAKTALLGDKGSAAYTEGGTFLGGYRPTTGDADGSAASTSNIAAMREYIDALQTEGQLTEKQNADLQELLPKLAERKAYYEVLKANYDQLSDAEKEQVDLLEAEATTYDQLVAKYDRAVYGQDALIEAYESMVSTGKLTEEQVKRLTNMYPELESRVVKTADGYTIQKNALYALINAENLQNAQIGNLVNGFIAEQKQTGATRNELLNLVKAQIQASNTGLNFSQQIQALQQLATAAGYTANYVNSVLGAGLNESNIKRTAAGLMQTGKYKSYDEAYAEAQRRAQSSLNYQWSKLTSTAPKFDWSSSFGGTTSVGTSTSGADKAEEARQAMIKKLQAERDQVQDAIDAINKKYDEQIEQLEKVNDELEDEIELQQILEEMAKAKASKKMVYKDGMFQYVDDMDAVAAAQTKLDEYNRKKALKDQKAYLEERRKAELKGYQDRLAILDADIKALQNYGSAIKSEYDDIIADYEEYLRRLAELMAQEEALRKNQKTGGGYSSGVSTVTKTAEDVVKKTTDAAKDAVNKALNTVNKAISGVTSGGSKSTSKSTSKSGSYVNNTGKSTSIGKSTSKTKTSSGSSSRYTSNRAGGHHAAGTMSAPGGLSLVGEQGPELRVLNQGDGILPANITRNLWAMATNPQLKNGMVGNTTNTAINVANVTLPNVKNADEFVAGLKNLAYQRAYAR